MKKQQNSYYNVDSECQGKTLKKTAFPPIDWETVPTGVRPEDVWNAHDTSVEGWVPVWFPTHHPESGMGYGEFQRAVLFNDNLERILMAMGRWPLWGSPRQKKHAVAFALLQLFCEVGKLCPRV